MCLFLYSPEIPSCFYYTRITSSPLSSVRGAVRRIPKPAQHIAHQIADNARCDNEHNGAAEFERIQGILECYEVQIKQPIHERLRHAEKDHKRPDGVYNGDHPANGQTDLIGIYLVHMKNIFDVRPLWSALPPKNDLRAPRRETHAQLTVFSHSPGTYVK